MTYKLAISDSVHFQIKLSLNDSGVKRDFSVWLEANRVSVETLQANIEEHGEMKVVDFQRKVCRDNITGWRDQRLVLMEDGRESAPFSPEALDLMLSVPGAVQVTHGAYLEAITAAAAPVGRLKNS